MNYFLLESDPLYTDAPILRNWSGKIDRSLIVPGKSHQIPSRMIFDVYPNAHMTFIDVIDSPFLLLSKACMDAVNIYEPQIVSKQIVLLDAENSAKQTYYLRAITPTCLKQVKTASALIAPEISCTIGPYMEQQHTFYTWRPNM